MHILLIHQIFVTPDEGGGTRHYELARYLVQKGHRVTVIASDIDYLTGKKKAMRETREGIEIIHSLTYSSIHKNFFCRAISFLSFSIVSFKDAMRIKDPDIIWGTSPPLFQALTAFLVSAIKHRPFVFEVRDLWVDFAYELGIVRNRFILKFMGFIEKILYNKSEGVIVNSPGFISSIERHIKRNKIFLVPNGVISEEFELKEKALLNFKIEQKLEGKFIAIYIGNIGVANDIDTIVKAAELLKENKDIVFVIMGGGIRKESLTRYLNLNHLKNIRIIDSRPKCEIPYILSDADVCIATLKNTPLLMTTYPNKVFDYMAAGKPTILAIDGVIRKVIEAAEGGIFVGPGMYKKLADVVVAYHKDPVLKLQHGKNARDYVKRHFEREKIAGELEQIMLKIMEKRN